MTAPQDLVEGLGSTAPEPSRGDFFRSMVEGGHEQIVHCHDRASGLRAIIAIHNTILGPALGGIRMRPYRDENDALTDVLRLSRAMSYKSAVAGLDLGGGKSVIIGGPADKSEALFRAMGRFIQSLGGRYVAATDVGTSGDDLTYVRMETSHVTGLAPEWGGLGDTSILTGLTVYLGMKAGVETVWGDDSLRGKRVLVQGAGKVGQHLMERLQSEGAVIFAADVAPEAVGRAVERFGATAVAVDDVYDFECDIFSPNGLGGVLDDTTIPRLRAKVVCGGANNQLADARHAEALAARGLLYVPDFVVNSGGVISAAAEVRHAPLAWAEVIARRVGDTTRRVLARAHSSGVPPVVAAEAMAEERLQQVGDLKRTYIPNDLRSA